MSVVTILENQKEKLSHEIAQMEKYVSTGPSGSLQVYKDKNHTKWYLEVTDDHGNRKRTYLPKNEISLAKNLALKTYYRHAITEKKSELSNIERFLKHSKPSFSDKFLDKESGYYELLKEHFLLSDWDNLDYEKNPDHPENLIVATRKGDLVRSKSEAFIADSLFDMGIDYKYELAMHIGDVTLYPDFTIIHPKSKKKYIWEHFGLMDKPSYVANSFNKIPLFISNGFMPGYNMIITYESKATPISFSQVKEIMNIYFG